MKAIIFLQSATFLVLKDHTKAYHNQANGKIVGYHRTLYVSLTARKTPIGPDESS